MVFQDLCDSETWGVHSLPHIKTQPPQCFIFTTSMTSYGSSGAVGNSKKNIGET